MFHSPNSEFLYSSYKIHIEYSDGTKTLSSSATGFVIDAGTLVPYFVTNRHVIDPDYKKTTSKYKDFRLTKFYVTARRQDDTEYSLQFLEDASIFLHDDYENDVALVMGRIYSPDVQTFHWHFGMEHLATNDIYSTIHTYDLVCYSGFPNTHDKLSNRPILRSGHIASDPKFNYSWNNQHQGQCVAYEGFSSPGASGSPVFAPPRGLTNLRSSRDGYLIGINAGHIPENGGHSGISYFYRSTVILEIIQKYQLDKIIPPSAK